MTDQEIKQEEIIEQVFKNFDTDTSGALEISELQKLFESSKI